jgi:hypothetical protein
VHDTKLLARLKAVVPSALLTLLFMIFVMQRATIAVHDGKILVKTEIVKAIITADKAVLIKGRWGSLSGLCSAPCASAHLLMFQSAAEQGRTHQGQVGRSRDGSMSEFHMCEVW